MQRPFREKVRLRENEFRFQCFVNSSSEAEGNHINVHPHWHDVVEILLVQRGSATQHIGDRIFRIGRGDIIIIQSQKIHGTYSEKETDILVFHFADTFFNTKEHPISGMCDVFNNRLNLSFPIASDICPGSAIKKRLYAALGASEERRPGWEFSVIAEIAGIMSICLENYDTGETCKKSSKDVRESLMKVFEYIESNYSGRIRLSDAVRITNYSTPHFCRMFKESLGMSFIEYLNRYRIESSLRMLSGEASITSIALDCGFQSINSYIREFRRIKGISPGRYRSNEYKRVDTKVY